jgi:hypothetical protein
MLKSRMSGAIPLLPICLYGVDRENFFASTRSRSYATEILVEEQGLGESDTVLRRMFGLKSNVKFWCIPSAPVP